MFEPDQDKKESSTSRLWLTVFLVVALAAVGIVFYKMSKPTGKGPGPASSSAAVPAKGDANPVHDLKILRAAMGKDRTGVTAVWSVVLENKSTTYTYSDIHYETSYIAADNTPVLINQGTLSATLGPGEQTTSDIRDALYPAGTAWYKFRITGASSTIR
jgi:hypothetical protein